MSKWLTSKEYREKYGISSAVLWARANRDHTVQTKKAFNKTYYLDESEEVNTDRQNVLYFRANDKDEYELLNDIINIACEYCLKNGEKPDIILKEVRSGDDTTSSEFRKLIDMIVNKKVNTLYIASEEVLSTNCYDFIKYICECCGTEIDVLNYNYMKS